MNRKYLILLHFIFWSIMIFNKLLPDFSVLNLSKPLISSFLLVNFLSFYFNYLVIVPSIMRVPKPSKFILGFFVSFLFFIFLRYLTEEIILPLIVGYGNYTKGISILYYIFDNFYWGSNAIFISSLIWFLDFTFRKENENKILLQQKNEAEIALLKSQINPHFIFNTLNNIYCLVNQKSDNSLDAIEKLGDLLRFSSTEIKKDFTSLGNEIKYLKNYIDLESLRISTPDNIIFEDNTENRNLEIAPMILIPFVENAFKHGNLKDFPLKISIGINGNQLLFHQKNKISKSRKDNSSGIGIENVKKRLSIIYSEKHTLEILNNEEFYEVNLKIDL